MKSSEIVEQDFDIIIYIAEDASDEGVREKGEAIITDLMKIRKDRELNRLYLDVIRYALKSGIQVYKKSDIISPADDVILSNDKVIVLGLLNITVERV